MTRLWQLVFVLALGVPLACQQQGEEAGSTEETAAVDAASVEQSIRASSDRFEQAMLAGDAATLTSFYADDAIVLPQGQPRSQGIDAIRAEFEAMASEPAARPTAFSLDPESIVVSESGDMAYEVGTFSYTGPGPDGTEMTDNGKYVAIWKPNATGEWKIAVDAWNSDVLPGAVAAGAATEETAVE